MSEARDSKQAVLAERLTEFTERSQHIVQEFWRNQAAAAGEAGYAVSDPKIIGRTFFELGTKLFADPGRLVEAQLRLWRDQAELWQNTLTRMQGADTPPLVEPEPSDRRFKDQAWSEDLLFDYIKQSYLLSARWLRSLVQDVPGLNPADQEKVDFYTRQFISAVAPSNFILTNPAVLRKAKETGGQNLLDGLERLLADLERGRGRLQISMVDEEAFEVGKNVASSPGKVIYQNDLMQLIQYAPSTEQVHKRPFLIVPPWINKFYILDLQPKNSFIKWCVDQGHTTFVISWVNPRADLAHKDFQDYMLEGPLAALDAMEQATGEREVNILGFCIGGILTAGALAYLAAKGDRRIKSATFLASLFDFKDVGEVAVFIDDEQLAQMEKHIAEKGYLEGHHMADMFNMMRENDLIWSFVVNNYLLGREPPPFDLLYWNSDSTRLPATMLLVLFAPGVPAEPADAAGRTQPRRGADRPVEGDHAHLHRRDQGGPHRAVAFVLPGHAGVRGADQVRARRLGAHRGDRECARGEQVRVLDQRQAAAGSRRVAKGRHSACRLLVARLGALARAPRRQESAGAPARCRQARAARGRARQLRQGARERIAAPVLLDVSRD